MTWSTRRLSRHREPSTPARRVRCAEILSSGQQCPHLAARGKTTCRYHPKGASR